MAEEELPLETPDTQPQQEQHPPTETETDQAIPNPEEAADHLQQQQTTTTTTTTTTTSEQEPVAAAAPAPAASAGSAPVHLLPLRAAPPAQPVHRVVRAAFAATGLPEILELRPGESQAITVQLVGVTPLGGQVRPSSHLRFVVRFYDFTAAVTPPVSLHPLGGGHAPYVVVSEALPEWATGTASPSTEFTGAPGMAVRFEVPGDAADSALLDRYMRFGGCMQIEAWDDESLLHVGTARVPLAGLADRKAEVWHEAALLEPVLPLQDERHSGRRCGLLQVRVVHCRGQKKRPHASKKIAEPVQPDAPDAKGSVAARRKKDPTEMERKLLRLHRLQASRFSNTDADRLDVHHNLDEARSAARTAVIKQSLEAAASQHLTVDCYAGMEPFFEHKLTNLQNRKQRFTVTCSPDAMALTATHHEGAALEMLTNAAHCEPSKPTAH
jgi:hypothetical protein